MGAVPSIADPFRAKRKIHSTACSLRKPSTLILDEPKISYPSHNPKSDSSRTNLVNFTVSHDVNHQTSLPKDHRDYTTGLEEVEI